MAVVVMVSGGEWCRGLATESGRKVERQQQLLIRTPNNKKLTMICSRSRAIDPSLPGWKCEALSEGTHTGVAAARSVGAAFLHAQEGLAVA